MTQWAEGKVLSIDRTETTFPEYGSTPPTIKVFIKSEGIQSILRQIGNRKVFETPVTIYNPYLLFIDITDSDNLKCHKVNVKWSVEENKAGSNGSNAYPIKWSAIISDKWFNANDERDYLIFLVSGDDKTVLDMLSMYISDTAEFTDIFTQETSTYSPNAYYTQA